MAIIFKARPRSANESSKEYIDNLKKEGILTDEMLNNSLTRVSDNGEIIIETETEIKEDIRNINRRSKRINLFVPESYYIDIQFLQILYPNLSLSEIVVKLANDYLIYIKKTDFWDKLNQLKELKNEREKIFQEFLAYKIENND